MGVKWDIFCAVVDNYGDIGVTWRLARQLVAEHGLAVRLWVDDLTAFAHLCPTLDPQLAIQQQAGVEVRHWPRAWQPVEVPDVVIEAFACNLPEQHVEAMASRERRPLWLNLEYLSAEDWVAGCHGLPSPQPGGLQKFFFFPGFVEGTGGLLREADLLAERDRLQADDEAQAAFLSRLGVVRQEQAQLISLFAYENAGLGEWLDVLSTAEQPIQLLVPQGRILADVQAWLGALLAPGDLCQRGNLHLQVLPFMPQADYDRLLWCCDFNAVRGEDSFIRAQWAARPLLWHIYRQEEGAHWDKLHAFLALYRQGLSTSADAALVKLWTAWNAGEGMAAAWSEVQRNWHELQKHARRWCTQQAARPDLASALVQFHRNWLS
ncbi:elongation factor P maturation arginine rhamnosyltransferase EarP [Pseudomonas sp. C11]|uniref:elongation factor P maturation arginine rhamnosyltransferase EarP n=1 Tax=Pseudomonas sp. C11 TaxID=3075550 RepID=UPI002AFF08F0|nr:elongation factor P maturation arginine rhamnosyltransferase EarP [Pseudomonas sp. C11]